MNPLNAAQEQQLLPALTLSTEDDPRVVREAATEDYSLHVVPRSGETHVFSTSTGARLSD